MRKKYRLWLSVILVVIHQSGVNCDARLSLTSQPQTSGTYCPGPVTFTCVGREIGTLSWLMNGSAVASHFAHDTDMPPIPLTLTPPLPEVTAVVTTVSTNPIDDFDITSVLNVNDISVLNGASLQCRESVELSEIINIEVNNSLTTPTSPSTSCSLLPSPGGAEVSLQWSPSFTSQYAVERYRVSVNPDPSSCSSEQVSPSEDYSCSGLVLGTLYIFTVSAINCGDQEGDGDTLDVLLESLMEPADLEVIETNGQQNYIVQWRQSSVVSEGCSTVGGVSSVDYIVTSVDSAGSILDQEVVTSDSCNNSLCSTSISGADICGVEVLATSLFGNSSSASESIGTVGVRLTIADQFLLAIGVVLLFIAIVIAVILIIMAVVKRASWFLVVVGCVLILMSALLWVGVAGLQNESCGSTTRSNLIIAAHVFSDVTFLVLVVSISFSLSFQCCQDSCARFREKHNKGCICLCQWLAPPRKGSSPKKMKEVWEIVLEQNRGKADLKEGEGGRIAILEGPVVMVDEVRAIGETVEQATVRSGEDIHAQYRAKLEEEAQYDTTQHSKPPPVTTPTEVPKDTYVQLHEHSRRQQSHKKEDKHYLDLQHKTGTHETGAGVVGKGVTSKPANTSSDEYGTLDNEGVKPPSPRPPRSTGSSGTQGGVGTKDSTDSGRGSHTQSSGERQGGVGTKDSTDSDRGSHTQSGGERNGGRGTRNSKKTAYDKYASKAPAGKLDLVLDSESDHRDEHLSVIADTVRNWDKLLPALELTDKEIASIQRTYKDDDQAQKRAMLRMWIKKQGSDATYGNLVKICLDNDNQTCAGMIVALWKYQK